MGTEVVIKGIVTTLKGAFPEYRVYTEMIKQGLKCPCFFVRVFEPYEKAYLGRRFFRGINFDVHFFPGDESVFRMGDLLYCVLEFIEADGERFRGTEMSYEVIDGVLHFYVSYNFFIKKHGDIAEGMDTLNVNTDTR